MTVGQICFDPDLLEKERQYREDVDQLTRGSLVQPDSPCVPEEEVPASFILNGLNPAYPVQVRDYFVNRPYYQTLACLWEEAGFTPEASPSKFRPLPVNQSLWANDPKQVIDGLGVRPKPLAVGTLANLFVRSPKTNAGMEALLPFAGHDQSLCGDYLLLGAYEAAGDGRIKHHIAASVMSRFFPSIPPHISDPLPEKPRSFLWEEKTEQAFPILKRFFESLPENSAMLLETAQTLATIGGEREYRYLTEMVLNWERPFHQEDAALKALLWAGGSRREVIPHLARVMDGKSEWLRLGKEIIVGRMSTMYANGLLSDERLLPGLFDFLVERRGVYDSKGEDENLPRWMALCGKKGNEYLLKLVVERTPLSDEFRGAVIQTAAAIEDPDVQSKIKEVLRGTAEEQADIRARLIGALARSKGAVSHQTLLELIDEFKAKPNTSLERIAKNLHAPLAKGETAIKYFLKLHAISKQHRDLSVANAASRACHSLADIFREAFSRHFEKFNAVQQKELVDQWVLEEGIIDPSESFAADASPKAKAMLRARIRDVREVRFSDRELWGMLFAGHYHVNVIFYLLDRLSRKGEAGTNFLIDVIQSRHIPGNFRERAVTALADSSSTRADRFLAGFIVRNKRLNDPLLNIAVRALQARAENPRFKAAATLALQQAFPL